MRRFVADDWPFKLYFAGAFVFWLAMGRAYFPPTFASVGAFAIYAAGAIASLFAILLGALIFSMLLVTPIYWFRAARNGAPFHPGDEVRILTGRERGRVVRVYSNAQGNSVRVDLGEDAKARFKDIYGAHQVMRVSARA